MKIRGGWGWGRGRDGKGGGSCETIFALWCRALQSVRGVGILINDFECCIHIYLFIYLFINFSRLQQN